MSSFIKPTARIIEAIHTQQIWTIIFDEPDSRWAKWIAKYLFATHTVG